MSTPPLASRVPVSNDLDSIVEGGGGGGMIHDLIMSGGLGKTMFTWLTLISPHIPYRLSSERSHPTHQVRIGVCDRPPAGVALLL